MTAGWAYVLRSVPCPEVCKIGRSTHSAPRRAREIAGDDGYRPFAPFIEVWSLPVPDTERVETAAHRMLHHRKVRQGRRAARELFRVSPEEARRVVEVVAVRPLAPHPPRRRAGARGDVWRSSRRLRMGVAAAALIGLVVYPPTGRLVIGGLVAIERQVVASLQ